MKAIGYQQSLSIDNEASLVDINLPRPQAEGRDLLVKITAIAVNPVDYKIRQRVTPEAPQYKVLGWDAVGEVVETGEHVQDFVVGDKVYYAGDLTRQGCNAEYQLVDERIAGRKPKSLSDAEAAALPLTVITAWELLFERLGIARQTTQDQNNNKDVLLVVGAAGGVGSILIQLAKCLTDAIVIATASRPASKTWVEELGADFVVDHSKDMVAQIRELGVGEVSHIASLNATDQYLDAYVDVLKPAGRLGLIDDPASLDVTKLKPKSISLHWEFMFTRSMFQTVDMQQQQALLNQVADLVDQGEIKTTIGKHLGVISADNLRAAHAELEAGRAIGKLVLEGFS